MNEERLPPIIKIRKIHLSIVVQLKRLIEMLRQLILKSFTYNPFQGLVIVVLNFLLVSKSMETFAPD